jgi:hypothetical protein
MPKSFLMMAQRLADVLDRENDALRTMDLRRTVTLLPEKTAAIAELAAADEARSGRPTPGVVSVPDLVSVITRVDRLAVENRRLLERAIGAQKRVIGIIARAAASVAVAPGYGMNGRRDRLTRPMALSTRA